MYILVCSYFLRFYVDYQEHQFVKIYAFVVDITSVNLNDGVSILCKMYPSYGIKNILHESLQLF